MLLSSLKKMGCKCLMRVTGLCRGDVSQLNDGGYSPSGDKKCHSLKVPTRLAKTIEEVKQWLNDASSRLNLKN